MIELPQDDFGPLEFYFTVLGERWKACVPAHGWTYDEARLAKRVTADPESGQQGMSPLEIGQRFLLGDPDAVMAIIRVTLKRAGRVLSTSDLVELGTINLDELATALNEAIQTRLNAGNPPPPAEAGSLESGPQTNTDNGSPAPLSALGENSTPETTPDQGSTAAAASVTAGLPSSRI